MVHIDRNILSIDIGGSKLMVGIVDHDGNVFSKEKLLLKLPVSEEYLVNSIFGMIEKLTASAGVRVGCAGVSVPGLADPENGVLKYAPFSGIRDLEIGSIISKKLKIPVFIENDANACAYAEMMFGACREVEDFAWITVSNGVGGALVLGGEIYKGAFNGAGEIGHINVEQNGHRCGCGNKGCLEVYAAGPAIVRRYKQKTGDHCEKITAKDIADAAKIGERAALDTYHETGSYLGKAISYLVNLLNPVKVILGGGISMDIDLFLPEIKKVVEKMVIKDSNKNLIIEKTALSYEASLIGAAAIAKRGIGGN